MTLAAMLATSVQALYGHSQALGTISSNIANVSTEGHKARETQFRDMVGPERGAYQGLYGLTAQDRPFIQRDGGFESSNNPLDIAVNGRGMLVTSTEFEQVNETIELTDAGRLRPLVSEEDSTDEEGNATTIERVHLVDIKGNYALAWLWDPETDDFNVGEGIDSLSPVDIGTDANIYEATATNKIDMTAVLPADSSAGDEDNPADQFAITLGIYDGLDTIDTPDTFQTVTFNFTRLPDDPDIEGSYEWQMSLSAEGGTVNSNDYIVAFDGDGNLFYVEEVLPEDSEEEPLILIEEATEASTDETADDATDENADEAADETTEEEEETGVDFTIPLSITWDGQEEATEISLDIDELSMRGDITPGLVDYDIDGNFYGLLSSYGFDEFGVLTGNFSNGQSRPIAKMAVGDVIAMDSLTPVTMTHYALNENTGDLRLYDLKTTDRAKIIPNFYETSTADLNDEFTNMIVVQRAYSSAATAMRTVDEMMKTAYQLK